MASRRSDERESETLAPGTPVAPPQTIPTPYRHPAAPSPRIEELRATRRAALRALQGDLSTFAELGLVSIIASFFVPRWPWPLLFAPWCVLALRARRILKTSGHREAIDDYLVCPRRLEGWLRTFAHLWAGAWLLFTAFIPVSACCTLSAALTLIAYLTITALPSGLVLGSLFVILAHVAARTRQVVIIGREVRARVERAGLTKRLREQGRFRVSIPELDNLVRIGKLSREPPAAREIDGLLASTRARLADADGGMAIGATLSRARAGGGAVVRSAGSSARALRTQRGS